MAGAEPSVREGGAGPIGPVVVVGVGLIGGSIGLALRARGVGEVRGVDTDARALSAALERGAIDAGAGSLAEALPGARVALLAAPVGRLQDLARQAIAGSDDDCLVSDVGSTKAALLAALTPGERERFIGGHPVAGGEGAGVAGARADLFGRATWFLTPSPETRPALYERLHGLVTALGARPVAIDAGAHDRLMALVSHLPHVLAATLIGQAAATAPLGREALRSAGPSFQDLTRVAGSNPPLWVDILIANRDAVVEALRDQSGRLAEVEAALVAGDRDWLRAFFESALNGRERLRAAAVDAVERPWRLSVTVPNRPGVISEIAMALGHAHINIEDLVLRPGVGGDGGVLSLLVNGEATAREAERLVAERGYAARAAEVR